MQTRALIDPRLANIEREERDKKGINPSVKITLTDPDLYESRISFDPNPSYIKDRWPQSPNQSIN